MAIKALEQESCEDAISRQAVIEAIDKWAKNMHVLIALPGNEVTPLFYNMRELPSVNPTKTGHWIMTSDYYTGAYGSIDYVECSCCHEYSLEEGNFCPNCGAKMIESQESEV